MPVVERMKKKKRSLAHSTSARYSTSLELYFWIISEKDEEVKLRIIFGTSIFYKPFTNRFYSFNE